MKKIYLDQNYIIIEADGNIIAIPATSSIYSHVITGEDRQEAAYSIRSTFGLNYVITEAEITAGDWEDADTVVWTNPNIVTFLRTNTGY